MRLGFVLAILALGGASIATAQTGTSASQVSSIPAGASGASANYKVGPGDVLSVTVYRSPDLSQLVTVGSEGAIEFPTIGALRVGGLTAAEVSAAIARQLKSKGVLIDPAVNVLVSQVRSKLVLVMGAVGRPGEFPLDRTMTISAVLAQAGATFGTGNGILTITRNGAGDAQRERVRIADIVSGAKDREVVPGEIFVVESAPTVYVSGEVGRPGAYPIEPNMTVGQALAIAGSVTPRGSAGRVKIMRKGADGMVSDVHKVRLGDQVKPDDLIQVPTRIF